MIKKFYFLLIILIYSCSSDTGHLDGEKHDVFDSVSKLCTLDIKLPTPKPGDWLYEHKEKGQTYIEYLNCKAVTANELKNVIYIQPLGNFSKETDSIIKSTVEYLHCFFGLKVSLLPVISDSLIKAPYKRIREDGHLQYLTSFILDSLLAPNLPKDGVAMMAITDTDLYPSESWNFVFGQAFTWKKVGISSIYRYIENEDPAMCLLRLIQTSSHEVGHMFSVLHCTNAICVMNGCNSLYESDSKPNRLCSVCLNKLSWNLKFNNIERFKNLKLFFEKYKMSRDLNLVKEDLEVYLKP